MKGKIIIAGSSGLIGTSLRSALAGHYEIACLTRQKNFGIYWEPNDGVLDPCELEDAYALIHLGGENIASRRWSSSFKAQLRSSRIQSTNLLARAITKLHKPPQIFLCASAVGYYGSCEDRILDESSPKGTGFLSDLALDWEAAANPAEDFCCVMHMRFGAVLSKSGGILAKLLPAFRLNAGTIIGNGSQYLSWIDLQDAVSAMQFLLQSPEKGPYNICSPHPVTNAFMTQTLASTLHKKVPGKMPALAARLLFGEMADELLLASQRAVPQKLLKRGFSFEYPLLQDSLKKELAASSG